MIWIFFLEIDRAFSTRQNNDSLIPELSSGLLQEMPLVFIQELFEVKGAKGAICIAPNTIWGKIRSNFSRALKVRSVNYSPIGFQNLKGFFTH